MTPVQETSPSITKLDMAASNTDQHPWDAGTILSFWFEATRPNQWFRQNNQFDQGIRQRFGNLCDQAQQGHLETWAQHPEGSLALVLLLDQFSRHVWRGSARAFAGDTRAVALSLDAVRRGWIDQEPRRVRRQFWLMPFLHSEALTVQSEGVELMGRYADSATTAVAHRHRDLIRRFGRFPHRNAVLQRTNTPDEELYLKAHQRRSDRP